MGWIKCVRCEKSRRDFVSWTFVLTAPVQYVLHQVSCSYETIPNAPKYCQTDQNISSGPPGWIGCVRWEKSQRDFAAPTFALIAPVHPVFHRVSCTYEMIPNAPKHYETHQNMNCPRVDQVRSFRKITTWLRGTNFCINCTSSECFASSFMQLQTIPNAPKYCETDRNISLESTRVDWVRLSRKIPTWLRVTNFCINCTSSVCFASSFMQLRNDPKCTEILWNRTKH